MYKELPEIEKYWLRWRAEGNNFSQLNFFLQNYKYSIKEGEKEAGINNCKATAKEVLAYSELPHSYLQILLGDYPFKNLTFTKDFPKEAYIAVWSAPYSFFSNYRKNKVIFDIDDDFLNNISQLEFPKETPVKALRQLPYNCICIPLKKINKTNDNDNEEVFALITYEPMFSDSTGELVPLLSFMYFSNKPNKIIPGLRLILEDDKTMEQAIKQSLEEQEGMNSDNKIEHYIAFRNIVNILLYVCGNDDIIQLVGHEYNSVNKKLIKRQPGSDKEIKKDLAHPTEFKIGVKYGSAIRKYKNAVDQAKESSEKTGITVRPHIRRAHSHLFWRGKRDGSEQRVPFVKYLPPIPVNMVEDEDFEQSVMFREIK